MKLYLYNTKDDNNVINKKLTDRTEFNISFKRDGSITHPTIILQSNKLLLFNYAYLPDFKRYYFINRIVVQSSNVYRLDLECDVLESFKDDILNAKAIITRSEDGNPFVDNGDYLGEVVKEIEVFESDVQLEEDNKIIMGIYKGGVEVES